MPLLEDNRIDPTHVSLFGVSSAQACWYFQHYPRDRKYLKALVLVVWCLDAAHLALYGATMWYYLIEKKLVAFGQEALPWTSSVQLLCNTWGVAAIQSFYIFRISALSKSLILTAVLAVFVITDIALGFTLFFKSLVTITVHNFVELQAFDIALSVVTAATDVLLSGTLVALLFKSRTGSESAKRIINKLLLYTINTGLLTSFCAVLSLIMASHPIAKPCCTPVFDRAERILTTSTQVLLSPATSIYIMFYYIGAHLYSVSLLANLNARESIRAQASDEVHTEALSRLTALLRQISPTTRRRSQLQMWERGIPPLSPAGIVVSIQRDTTVVFDNDAAHGTKGAETDSDACGPDTSTSRGSHGFLYPDTAITADERASGGWEEVDLTRLRLTPSPYLR
ncbi:hypothetical protein BD413DRAFT_611613 [Trametes elegans]|nr:hypothetical protein BD413DRAFT_611613 [Trametes elegans]